MRSSKGAAEVQVSHCTHQQRRPQVTLSWGQGLHRAIRSTCNPPSISVCAIQSPSFRRMDSSPSHNCVLAHLDPCVSSDSPRFISASPRLHGAWGLDLSHVSGSFTSMDGWSVLPWSSVFMGMFRDSEIHTHNTFKPDWRAAVLRCLRKRTR